MKSLMLIAMKSITTILLVYGISAAGYFEIKEPAKPTKSAYEKEKPLFKEKDAVLTNKDYVTSLVARNTEVQKAFVTITEVTDGLRETYKGYSDKEILIIANDPAGLANRKYQIPPELIEKMYAYFGGKENYKRKIDKEMGMNTEDLRIEFEENKKELEEKLKKHEELMKNDIEKDKKSIEVKVSMYEKWLKSLPKPSEYKNLTAGGLEKLIESIGTEYENFKKLTDIEYEELLKEKVRSLRNSEILKHEFYKKELEADFKRDKNFIENLTFEEEYAKSRASQDDEYSMIQYNKQITEKQIDKEVEDLLRFNFKHGIPDSLEIIQEKAKTQI